MDCIKLTGWELISGVCMGWRVVPPLECRPKLMVELELEVVDDAELLVFRLIDVTVSIPLVGAITDVVDLTVAAEVGD